MRLLREGVPAYIWFSGVLCQVVIVLYGLQYAVGLVEWRVDHQLANSLRERLGDAGFCTQMFKGQSFSWMKPQNFNIEHNSRRAEIRHLSYQNVGSAGMDSEGHHFYNIDFNSQILDLSRQHLAELRPLARGMFEVDRDNRVIRCLPVESAKRLPASVAKQDSRKLPCETSGWERRVLCDAGTERCYPVAQCEKGGG